MKIIINNNNCLVEDLKSYFDFSIDYADKCLYGICKNTKREKVIFDLIDYNIDNRKVDNLIICKDYIEYTF
jgi:hypothetical protein